MDVRSESVDRVAAIKYRPDIDGLRAVAVLSVLAYHIGGLHTPGGFVGVDVFFVISGYLISAIILKEVISDSFSVLAFYERRVRRILPAFFGMLIVFSAIVSFYLLPTELLGYARALLAAVASVSNFYLWQHSGYFDSPSSNPLLHTWSLSVEEQFYVLFPVLMIAIRRLFPRKMLVAVVLLFLASLIASILTVRSDPTTAFYMLYTRAWELLLGTILALGLFPRLNTAAARNVATIIGIGLILYSVLEYSKRTPFPGVAALVPCLGTMLIIGAGEYGPSIVGRVLSWRPVVLIGLMSYSLYLWHWPVIFLHKIGLSVNLGDLLPARLAGYATAFRFDMVIEIIVSFLLGFLSWRFVERPFRSRSRKIGRRPLFMASAVVASLLVCFSVAVIAGSGFKGRFPEQAVKLGSFLATNEDGNFGTAGGCFRTDTHATAPLDNDRCLKQVAGKRNYLLIGDSHAAALWNGLNVSLAADHVMLASVSNCRPLVHPTGSADCKKEMDYIFDSYLPSNPVSALLLQARWRPEDMVGLAETVSWAKQHEIRVVLIGPVPEYDAPLPRLLAYSIAWNKPQFASQHQLGSPPLLDKKMEDLAVNRWQIPYISLYQAICNNDRCIEYADSTHDVPLMNDENHLNQYGSSLVSARLLADGQFKGL